MTPLGTIVEGRDAIRGLHATLFAGPLARTESSSSIRRTVFLDRDTRIVDLDVELTGVLPPGQPQVEPGVVRQRVKWIVVQRDGGWKILDHQVVEA